MIPCTTCGKVEGGCLSGRCYWCGSAEDNARDSTEALVRALDDPRRFGDTIPRNNERAIATAETTAASDPKKPWEETWTAEIHPNAVETCSRIRTDSFASEGDEEILYANDGGRANFMAGRVVLAAAAPEMYRAIAEILFAFDRGAIPYRTDVCEALDRAEAVLKKARGE